MNIEFVKEHLDKHGEIHVVVEEHEAVLGDSDEQYIGLRSGNTEFDDANEVIHVDDGRKCHHIGYERIVYIEPAIEFPD